jgi:hypothetical protein
MSLISFPFHLLKKLNKKHYYYLLLGLINTLLSYLLYLIFLNYFRFELAYSFSFLSTLLLTYYTNIKFVFKVPISFLNSVKYPIFYFLQFIIGYIAIKALINFFSISTLLAPLLYLIISIPLNYLILNKILN